MIERAAGLVEAVDDPNLLGSFAPYPKQRELLESIEEGPRLHVLACGRRAGKTSIGAAAAVWDATLRPVLARYLRPGERRYAVCVAVNLRQARHFVSICRALVESSPLLRRLLVTASDDELVFSTGCTIAAFPCTARGGRGWPISTLVLDEHAHHVDLEGSNIAAEQVWRALAPSTYQFGHDGRIVVASTPWGTEGHFAELFKRVQGGAEGRVYQYASHELNTALDPETLAEEFANDPDAYRSEVLAEFVPGGGNYIDPVRLADAVGGHGTLGRLDALAGSWVLGCDLAFSRDPAAAVLVGREAEHPERIRVGGVWSWEPQRTSSFEERRAQEDSLVGEVAAIANYYGARVVIDQYMAPQVATALARADVAVETLHLSAETKSLAFAELRSRLFDGTLVLLDDADLLRELRSLRSQVRAGKASVTTPRTRGAHADRAVALALAVWAHAQGGGDLEGDVGWLNEQGRDVDPWGLGVGVDARPLGMPWR
ncbi:MAG TPA: hypothetical protein VFA24_07565 [Gaiellaceae bacterium]|nr:hypothetical protein [Gaiellaceae bacterium]